LKHDIADSWIEWERKSSMDIRDFALELIQDRDYDAEDMLIAALKYMSTDEIIDMLETNDYPLPEEGRHPC